MYALRTRSPLVSVRRPVTVRLACIKPPASVHPEPGSNSPSINVLCPQQLVALLLINNIAIIPYFLPIIIKEQYRLGRLDFPLRLKRAAKVQQLF